MGLAVLPGIVFDPRGIPHDHTEPVPALQREKRQCFSSHERNVRLDLARWGNGQHLAPRIHHQLREHVRLALIALDHR